MNLLDEICMLLERERLKDPTLEFFFILEEDGDSRIVSRDRFGGRKTVKRFATTDEVIEAARTTWEDELK